MLIADEKGLDRGVVWRWLFGALAVGVLGFVLLRAGLHWLLATGLVVFAALRKLWPLLARIRGGSARSAPSSRARRRMTRREAAEVLGVDEHATKEEILAEYRRVIKQVHPDRGGSDYLAAQVNEAREVLLRDG